jgi:trehalose 6-phosphate phosphatase
MIDPALPPATSCCLFLDIDGTLLDYAPTPEEVQVDEALLDLLRTLDHSCQGAVALISGRSIADIDALLDPLCLAVAGIHGCERRDASGNMLRPTFEETSLREFRARLGILVRPLDGIWIEDKGCALALHFRLAPRLESPLRAVLQRLQPLLPPDYEFLDGDHVIELKPAAHSKATAVQAFMQEAPFAGRFPVYIGDDITDQDGFVAVQRFNGLAIGVGDCVTVETRLPDPRAVRRWLEAFLLRDCA